MEVNGGVKKKRTVCKGTTQCPDCKQEFSGNNRHTHKSINRHLEKCNGIKKRHPVTESSFRNTCPKCKKVFTMNPNVNRTLRKHVADCKGNPQHECLICGEVCQTKESLGNHMSFCNNATHRMFLNHIMFAINKLFVSGLYNGLLPSMVFNGYKCEPIEMPTDHGYNLVEYKPTPKHLKDHIKIIDQLNACEGLPTEELRVDLTRVWSIFVQKKVQDYHKFQCWVDSANDMDVE